MKVVIMFRNSYVGGDGWDYGPLLITISDNCPVCGGQRGVPYDYRFCEDGQWYMVDKWNNPCGHVDTYKDAFFEHRKIQSQIAGKEN